MPAALTTTSAGLQQGVLPTGSEGIRVRQSRACWILADAEIDRNGVLTTHFTRYGCTDLAASAKDNVRGSCSPVSQAQSYGFRRKWIQAPNLIRPVWNRGTVTDHTRMHGDASESIPDARRHTHDVVVIGRERAPSVGHGWRSGSRIVQDHLDEAYGHT